MPFKSQAQRRLFYATMPEKAKEWEKETPKAKLPEKVKHKTETKKHEAKETKKQEAAEHRRYAKKK